MVRFGNTNKTYYNKAKLPQSASLLYIFMHFKATALQQTIRESLRSKGVGGGGVMNISIFETREHCKKVGTKETLWIWLWVWTKETLRGPDCISSCVLLFT